MRGDLGGDGAHRAHRHRQHHQIGIPNRLGRGFGDCGRRTDLARDGAGFGDLA
jgi:hypothetical protein